MINVSILESDRYFEYGLRKLVTSYFFYKNLKVNFTGYDRTFAGESMLVFRSLDTFTQSFSCYCLFNQGLQRVIPICMPKDLTRHEVCSCIRDTTFFFRNDSIETLLKKLDKVWLPQQSNNHSLAHSNDVPYEDCRFQRLSYSEKNIIRYIGLGFSVSTISRMLKKNVKTVSSQKRSAMRKLNMNRDIELYQFLSHSILM